jgi:ribosomal protein S28E/S33
MAKKKRVFDQKNEVRAIARERVGPVKASKVIVPKDQRKKPKYKRPPEEEA